MWTFFLLIHVISMLFRYELDLFENFADYRIKIYSLLVHIYHFGKNIARKYYVQEEKFRKIISVTF